MKSVEYAERLIEVSYAELANYLGLSTVCQQDLTVCIHNFLQTQHYMYTCMYIDTTCFCLFVCFLSMCMTLCVCVLASVHIHTVESSATLIICYGKHCICGFTATVFNSISCKSCTVTCAVTVDCNNSTCMHVQIACVKN